MRVVNEIHSYLGFCSDIITFEWRDIEGANFSRELFELHNVARKCSSFVWKDVLNLAKLLVDVCALRSAEKALVLVEHMQVVLHEIALEELYHL